MGILPFQERDRLIVKLVASRNIVKIHAASSVNEILEKRMFVLANVIIPVICDL